MTSTNDGKEVKSNQTSSQKGKLYFIEIYKSLDLRLCGDCSGLERTQHVCEAWRRIYSLCSHSAPSTHPHLLSWLQRHTATTVLQTEWTNCPDQHTLLREAIDEFIQDCKTSIAKRNVPGKQWELQLLIRAEWFKTILPNPWGHPVLKALLDSDQTPSDQEILEWLKEERGVMFVTRLRQMAALKSCVDLALRLAAAVMQRARAGDPRPPDLEQVDSHKETTKPPKDGTFAAILRKEAGFTTDVWEFLTDLEFVLLHKSTQRSCIDLAKQVPFRDACTLVERLQSRPDISPKEKKVWKNAKEVALLIAQVVIARCMVVPSCRGAVLIALYGCSRSIARLMTAAQLSAASVALAAPAASAHHLHTMAAAVHKQLKGERTQFVCQLYVRAITAGMNELERLKLNKEKSAEARSTEQTLSTWFKHLGSLLSKSNRLRYECLLTAFSVHPTPDMFEEVKGASVLEPIKDIQEPNPATTTEFGSWATDSRTQTNFVKTSETLNLKKTQKQANVLSTAIFSEGDALGLEPELCNDLAVLLSGPRVKTLTWDMEREALLENCRTYMKRTDCGTRALTTELKYLNLDPSSFQHLPEEDDNEDDVYYGIEKGYEHLVELQEPITDTMPPEIWQEAFYESPLSSDESVTVVRRRKKKKKKIPVVVATTAEDPLKLETDIAIDTNTEGSNNVARKETEMVSKEVSQDIEKCNSSTKGGKKNKKEKKKERKKEKKEAKQRKKKSKIDTGQEIKKEPSKGALTKLLGMKVARKNHELRNLIKNTERMMFPTRSLESKDKKVCNTQEPANVIFDGLYSMDELSLLESQNKGRNLKNKEERACITQSVTKDNPPPLTPIKHDIYNEIKTKIVNEITDDVKSSIKKLIGFRRQKVEKMNTIKSTQKVDSTNSKLVPDVIPKSVISHTLGNVPKHDIVQKLNQKEYPGCNYPLSAGYSITKLHNDIQNNDTSRAIIKNINESPSQKAYEEFLMLRSSEAMDLLNTSPVPQSSQTCQNQYQDLSKIYYSNPSLLKNELKHPDKTFPGPDQSLYPEEGVHKSLYTGTSQNNPKKSSELSKKLFISAPFQCDPTQKQYQEFLKELQESVNPGTMCKQKPEIKQVDMSVGSKILKAPKIAENAPNTFSRLSYLHKSKQMENKLKTEQENKAKAAANYVPKDLNRMLPIHLQNRGEVKISRVHKKTSGTDPKPLKNNKKSEPSTSRLAQNHRNLVQALQIKPNITKNIVTNIVTSELNNKINNNQIIYKTESIINTKLSENDQKDLLQLLIQQNRLNATNVTAIVQPRLDPSATSTDFSKMLTTKDPITVPTTTVVNATRTQIQQKNLTKIINPHKKIEALDTEDRFQHSHNPEYKSESKRSEFNTNTENTCIKTPNAVTPKYIQFKILKDSEQEVFDIKDMDLAQSCNFLEPKYKEIINSENENSPSENKNGNTVPHKQPTKITTLPKEQKNTKPLLCDEKIPEKFVNNKEVLEDKTEQRLSVNPDQSKSINVSVLKKKSTTKKPLISRKIKETSTETSDKARWESVFNDLLKHKTPSRGPNALDVALKKDTFKQHMTQPIKNSDNQRLSTNKNSNKNNVTKPEKKITVALDNQPTVFEGKVSKSIEKTTDTKRFIELQPKEEDPFISGIPNSDYDLLDELMDDDLRQEIRELSDDEAYCPMDLYTPKEKDNITGPGTVIEKPTPNSTPYLNVGNNGQTKIMPCSNPKSVITNNPQKSSTSITSGILSSELAVNTAKMSKNISTKKPKAKKANTPKVKLKPQHSKKQVRKDAIDTSIDRSRSENPAAIPSSTTISTNFTKLTYNTTAVRPSPLLLKVHGNTDLENTSSSVTLSNNSAKSFQNTQLTPAPSVSMSKDITKISHNTNSVVTCSSVSLPNVAAAPSSIALLNNTKIPRHTSFVAPGNVILKPSKTKGTQNIMLVGSDIAYGLITPINLETSTADTNSYSSKNRSFVNPTTLTNLVKPVVISNVSLNLTPTSIASNPMSIETTEVNVKMHGESIAIDLQNRSRDENCLSNTTVIVSSAHSNTETKPELIEGKSTKNMNIGIEKIDPNQSTSNNSSKTSQLRSSVIANKFGTGNKSQYNERKVLSEVQEKLTLGEKSVIQKYCPFKNSLTENDIKSNINAERLKKKRFAILNRQINHYNLREPIPLAYTSLRHIEKVSTSLIKENLNTKTQTGETYNNNSLKIENIQSKQIQNIKTGLESESCELKTDLFKTSESHNESSVTSLLDNISINENNLIPSVKAGIIDVDNDTRNLATDVINKHKVVQPNIFDRETGTEKMSSEKNMSSQNIESKITMQSARKVSNEVDTKSSKDVLSSIDIPESCVLKSNETTFHQHTKCNVSNYTKGNDICQNKQTLNSNVKLDNSKKDKSVLDMYRDRIHFEELPKKPTDDPMKRIVRIKLPNGTVFKATISGKLDINIDSIFSDPQMKTILLNNVSKTKKCTLNIKQVTIPDDSNSREKTIVNKILYPNNIISNESETINLVSDDECDEIDKCIFKTEFGEFSVSFKDHDVFIKHQKRLSDKCTVQLEKSGIIDKIIAAKACLRLKSHTSSDVLLNNADDKNNGNTRVIEIDDSSDDSIMESLITHVPLKERILRPKLSTDIDLLRNSVIKGLKLSNIHEDSDYSKSKTITEISSFKKKCSKNISRDPIINEGIVDLTAQRKKIRMMKSCHVKLVRCDDDSKSSNFASKNDKPIMDDIQGQIFKNSFISNGLLSNEFNNQNEENYHSLSTQLDHRSGTDLPINVVPCVSGVTCEKQSIDKNNEEYDGHVSTTSEYLVNNDTICEDENKLRIIMPNKIERTVTSFNEDLHNTVDTEEGKYRSLGVQELPMVVKDVSPEKVGTPVQCNDIDFEREKSLKNFKEYDVQKAASFEVEDLPIIDVNVRKEEIDEPKLIEYDEEEKNRPNTICKKIKADNDIIRVNSESIDQPYEERNNLPSVPLNESMENDAKQDRLAADAEIYSINNKVLSGEIPNGVEKLKRGIDQPVNEILSINKSKAYENQSVAPSGIKELSLNSVKNRENENTIPCECLIGLTTDKMKEFKEGIDLPSPVKKLSVANYHQRELKQDLSEKLLISKEKENEVHSSIGKLLINEKDECLRSDLTSVADNLLKDDPQKFEDIYIKSLNEESSLSEKLSKNHDCPVLNEKISINEDKNQERKNVPPHEAESFLNDMEQYIKINCIRRELPSVDIKEHEEVKDISSPNHDISLSEDSLRQEKDENMASSNETKDLKELNDILTVSKDLCFEKLIEEKLYEGDSQKEDKSKDLLLTHIDSQYNDVCYNNKISLDNDSDQYEKDHLTCTVGNELSSPILERRGSFSILVNYSTDFDTKQDAIDHMSSKSFCECFADWYLTKPLIHHHCNMTAKSGNSLPCESIQIRYDNPYLQTNISTDPEIGVIDMTNMLKNNKKAINICNSDWYYTKPLIHIDSTNLNLIFQKQLYMENPMKTSQECVRDLDNIFQLQKNVSSRYVLNLSTIMANYFANTSIVNFLKSRVPIEQSLGQRQSRKRKIVVSESSLINRKMLKESSVLRRLKSIKSDSGKKCVIQNCDNTEAVRQENNLSITDTNKKENIQNPYKILNEITLKADHHNYNKSNLDNISQIDEVDQSWTVSDTVNQSIVLDKTFIQDFIHREKVYSETLLDVGILKVTRDKFNLIDSDSNGVDVTEFQSFCIKNDVIDCNDSIITTDKENIKVAILESQEVSCNSQENDLECERPAIADCNDTIFSPQEKRIDEDIRNGQQTSKVVPEFQYINKIHIITDNEIMDRCIQEKISQNVRNISDREIDSVETNKNCLIETLSISDVKEECAINALDLYPKNKAKVDNMSEPEVKSHNTHKYGHSHSKIEDGIITNNIENPDSKAINSNNLIINEIPKDENSVSISKKLQKNVDTKVSDEIEVKRPDHTVDCQERPIEISNEHKEEVVDNITLLYKGDSDLILKGSVFKDPVVGTCYLFPIRTIRGKDCKSLPKKSIFINEDVKLYDSGDSLNVMIPKITYSKQKIKLTENRLYTYTKRNLKRKSDATDSKYFSQKRYRNGKNIDYPKIPVSAIKDFAYVKEFKVLYDYWESIKFSFSRPFHKENFDVNKLLKSWPIQGEVQVINDKAVDENILFLSNDDENRIEYDPLHQTLADELASGEKENIYQSIEINENNFSMGFGEGSDRVIQQYVDRKTIRKISAATLSDVKPTQPFSTYKYYHDETTNNNNNDKIININEDQIEVTKRFITHIRLKNKVRSFFKRTTVELNRDWIFNNMKESDKNSKHQYSEDENPFDIYNLDFFGVPSLETIVQVVQVGQSPVSAAAQNPVSCDPRVTQVTDASPPQCSAENSPRDGSQPSMKNEYTELTTADLSVPLVQEYERHNNQTMNLLAQENHKSSFSDENIPIETEVNSIVKIEIAEEVLDNEEQNDNGDHELHNIVNHVNDRNYCFDTNDTNTTTDSQNLAFQNLNDTDSFIQNEEHHDKTDQIAHAMNAAGITTNAEQLPSNESHTIGNVMCVKSNEDANTPQTLSNNYSKTTSINAVALQQALAQILPPPLNRTTATESNHQTSNNPQVLHIVQGKNSSVNQLTLVDNTQQSVINTSNSTPVLHIVQNKGQSHSISSNTSQPANSFNGLSLVDSSNMVQGGSQLLHIVNASGQKTNNTGQLLKRVNLLTNLSNVQGGNEQKMVQFVCKSADGKSIQLNAPHQRNMVLRLQPIESTNVHNNGTKTLDNHNDLNINGNITSANNSNESTNNQQEIKSRSVYEENYAKFIQNSGKSPVIEKSTSLPKFNQAFGKQVFQDENQKANEINENHSHLTAGNSANDNSECQTENSINMDQLGQINTQTLILRKSTDTPTSQSQPPQPNLVQQLKQTIAPMNLQTMHGGVIYTRQIPVNIGGGQTINLITVPSTELLDDSNQKQHVNQSEIEQSIIKIVPQNQSSNSEVSTEESRNQVSSDSTSNTQPQPVLTQMRIKLPMLSKPSQIVSGTRVVRPSFFQIQRNVIGGTNQQVYQQLVLTAAPPLGQQTIRLPQSQTNRLIKVPSENQTSPESQMSSSTLEQLREFDMVLEQVKERSTVQPNPPSNNNAYNNNSKVYTSSTDTTDITSHSTASSESTHQVLYTFGNNSALNVAYVNRKTSVTTPTLSTYIRSPDSSNVNDSPSSSTQNYLQHSATSEAHANELSSSQNQHKPSKITSKSKSKPKPTMHPSSSVKLNTVPPKPSNQKPFEDEQTTQRILYILAEYKEQVENSPDKDKPAPRRRTNPPSNPGSSKRKKSSRRSGTRDMSPVHGEDSCRTMGSEDSSCGTSQGDCNESCMDSHSPQDSPRKVVKKLTFEPDAPAQPRPQPQRNVIVADGQTITVSRNNTTKPTTAVLMPANYILPVSMVKSGQQIAIVTNRGPKILTVGGGEGGGNAVLLQRLIGPGLKPVLTRPGVRHVRLPAAALHNLQAFTLGSAASQQPDSTASAVNPNPPELIDTRATASPWVDREGQDAKPEKQSSPESTEPWNIASSNDPHDYSYEEIVRSDNMDRTVLDAIPDRYSPDMEAQRIFDKMFDIDSKRSYIVDSQDDSPRCGYDIDASDCDDRPYHQVVHRKDGTTQRHHRLTHVSSAALRHRYAILEHELRLQKSLSEECEDLGVDSPSASELFPEAELLFSSSPAHEANHHSHTPQPITSQSTIPQPDMDDQIATDQLISHHDVPDEEDLNMALGLDNIVTVSGDGTITLDPQEFARSHPNTTFHKEPTDESELQPFTIANVKGRHMTSTIFHASRAPATVLVTAPQTGVIAQAAPDGHGAPAHSRHAAPSAPSAPSVLVKDNGVSKFDNMLDRELHLSNTASTVIHGATQVIRRVCYDDDRHDPRFLPAHALIGHDAKMTEDSRDATLESMADVDDDRSTPERNPEMFWEENSTSERSEGRRPLDFSSDSDKCCKSPFEETNSTDSSGVGTHIMRLDSVIKDTRGMERSCSADGSSADDTHPPLRTYPPKRYLPPESEERSTSGKTRAGEGSPDLESRRRASNRGVVKRGCHCCNGSPAPPKTKKSRPKKLHTEYDT